MDKNVEGINQIVINIEYHSEIMFEAEVVIIESGMCYNWHQEIKMHDNLFVSTHVRSMIVDIKFLSHLINPGMRIKNHNTVA